MQNLRKTRWIEGIDPVRNGIYQTYDGDLAGEFYNWFVDGSWYYGWQTLEEAQLYQGRRPLEKSRVARWRGLLHDPNLQGGAVKSVKTLGEFMERRKLQEEIIREIGMIGTSIFDPETELELRVNTLKNYLFDSGMHTLVLGISGGIDSTTAGRLAQLAVEDLRADGHKDYKFIAVRLPYGTQKDDADAQLALDFIKPDTTLYVNIASATHGMIGALAGEITFNGAAQQDFVMGNIKARQRMVAQYAIAGATKGLVIGTDHAAESVMGFFTKFGDGGADVLPLAKLNKRMVRALAEEMGAPEKLVKKVPTADLEDLNPGKPDEVAYGVSYDEIDDFLEGQDVSDEAFKIITEAYKATKHKRQLPIPLAD